MTTSNNNNNETAAAMSGIIKAFVCTSFRCRNTSDNAASLRRFIKNYGDNDDAVYIQNQWGLKEFQGTVTEALGYLVRLTNAESVHYNQAAFYYTDEEYELGKYLLLSIDVSAK